MPQSHDIDEHLQALRAELRTTITALNSSYHPVYPATSERIAQLEATVADIKAAITERKKLLREMPSISTDS